MSYPRLVSSAQFRDLLVRWFNALFAAKFDAGDAVHGPPGLYEKPRPLDSLREEIMDSWAYLGAAQYQRSVILGLLDDGIRDAQTLEDAVSCMTRVRDILTTGNDIKGSL